MSEQLKNAVIRRLAIWDAMGRTLYPRQRPLLTLEQFFLHSMGGANLWYNIYPQPDGIDEIDQYEFHAAIRAKPEVWDVLISITSWSSSV